MSRKKFTLYSMALMLLSVLATLYWSSVLDLLNGVLSLVFISFCFIGLSSTILLPLVGFPMLFYELVKIHAEREQEKFSK